MMVDELIAAVQELLRLVPEIEAKLLASLVAIVFLWLVRRVLQFVIGHWRYRDVGTRYQARKTAGYLLALIGILLLGRIWVDGFESFITILGLISAGLVIALKDMMIDLAGWFFILWRHPFSVGDRIQIGDLSGDVIDIRMFQFTLLEIGNWVDADQSTGRLVHVPNGRVFNEPQANYTQGLQYIWDEIPVTITFDSNWPVAKILLQAIASKHTGHFSETARQKLAKAAEKYYIFYSKLTPTVYTNVKENGIVLTIRYLSEPRRRRGNAQAIWEDILREFGSRNDISFAYPTHRFYNHKLEGPARPYNPNGTALPADQQPEPGQWGQAGKPGQWE